MCEENKGVEKLFSLLGLKVGGEGMTLEAGRRGAALLGKGHGQPERFCYLLLLKKNTPGLPWWRSG